MRSQTLLITTAAALALVPASASAATFCVPTSAACPGAGTTKATLESALAAAEGAPDADVIHLAAGTYTAPTTAGFAYDFPAGSLDVVGAGSSGTGRTVLTTPAGATRVLRLRGASGSGLSHLAVEIADDAVSGGAGQVQAGAAALDDVAVTTSDTQANAVTGVELLAGATMEGSSVAVSLAKPSAIAVLVSGPGVSLSGSELVGRTGLDVTSAAVTTTADRLEVDARTGVSLSGAKLALTSSTVRVEGSSGCGVCVSDQPATDGELTVDGVTITAPDSRAVSASSLFDGRTSAAEVRNSILSGGHGRGTFSSATGKASVEVRYSDFDPATDVTLGSGPQSFTPAAGKLGTTNTKAAPKFVGGDDLHLAAGSPAIDTGDPATGPGFDLDGLAWLQDGNGDCNARRDMGAYERPATPTCTAPPPLSPAQPADAAPPADPAPNPPAPPATTPAAPTTPAPPADPAPTQPTAPGADPGPSAPQTAAPAAEVAADPGPPAAQPTASASTAPQAPADPGAIVPPARTDRSAPVVSRLRVGRGAVTFVLSEPARVCTTRADGRDTAKRSCRAGAPGRNRVLLPRQLHRGRYTVRVSAVDGAGNRGVSRRVAFRIGS